MKMIKLVISDLDGTFLNSTGDFDHDYYSKVKKMMEEKNVIFAACTGKQCERVEEVFGPELSKDVWILGDSATRIKYNGAYVHESLLPNMLGVEIINKLEGIASDHIIIACTPTAAYIHSETPDKEEQMVRGSYTVVQKVDNLQEIDEDFVKITVFDPKLRCFDNVQKIQEFNKVAYIVASEAAWIDISNYGIHKGTTVKELQKILKVEKEETIAFGDGYNDLELFSQAGLSFAMKNAFEEIKDRADFVVKSNNENGVLSTIEKFLAL